nr:hypothetical protein [Lactiplantibacillus plantarum]
MQPKTYDAQTINGVAKQWLQVSDNRLATHGWTVTAVRTVLLLVLVAPNSPARSYTFLPGRPIMNALRASSKAARSISQPPNNPSLQPSNGERPFNQRLAHPSSIDRSWQHRPSGPNL